MSANTETTGGPEGYGRCYRCATAFHKKTQAMCWRCWDAMSPGTCIGDVRRTVGPDWTPPIAAPAAHVERRNGQRWRLRNIQTGRVREVTLGSLLSDGVWETDDNGGIGASAWRDPRFVMTLLDGAPPEPAKPHTCLNHCGSRHCDCDTCSAPKPIVATSPPAQEAPKAAPVCSNNGCKTPTQNVAQRWSPRMNDAYERIGADLEWSCEPCHLLDEKEFAGLMTFESTGTPYAGPERLPKPQLAADWAEDCLPTVWR